MKYKVTLNGVLPIEAIAFKQELIESGLVLDVDFIWEYFPQTLDESDFAFSIKQHKHAVFSFNDPKLATFYELKWK